MVLGCVEIALGRIVDDVLERGVDRLGSELDRVNLVRLGLHLVEDGNRVDRRRLISDETGQRGALGAVALAGRAEAAEQMDLERRRLAKLRLPAA